MSTPLLNPTPPALSLAKRSINAMCFPTGEWAAYLILATVTEVMRGYGEESTMAISGKVTPIMRSISPLTGHRRTEDHFVVPSGGKQVVADSWATFRKWDFPGPFCGITLYLSWPQRQQRGTQGLLCYLLRSRKPFKPSIMQTGDDHSKSTNNVSDWCCS